MGPTDVTTSNGAPAQPTPLLIVYSGKVNAFYESLARRFAEACAERGRPVRLWPSEHLADLAPEEVSAATVALVNAVECAHAVPDRRAFIARLSSAQRRVLILAEAVETQFFENQFQLSLSFDALIDVGFVSQQEKLTGWTLPYHFVFNGPTRREQAEIVEMAGRSDRPIPWAVIGHRPNERIRLVEALVTQLDPGGFVYLANAGVFVREGQGTVSPNGLAATLAKTRYYVWRTHHRFSYYESFRFVDALLGGAVPCKVDEAASSATAEIPGIYPSVEALCEDIRAAGFSGMQERARDFYLSRGLLADHLPQVLSHAG